MFSTSSRYTEQKLLDSDYGFSFVTTRPTVGPNLDPKKPKQPPVAPGVEIQVWWAAEELFEYRVYERTKTFQVLKVFCTEMITDECGNTSEFSTNTAAFAISRR